MRADRLLSELMLLQVRGKLNAAEMAQELEVSERTIYRDMVALSISGIPVYAEAGLGGGFSLIDGYRTQLTGMNDQELRALFALNIPDILGALGMDESLSSAMRKLQAALPAARGNQGQWMQQRFYFDSTPWWETSRTEVKSHLTLLQNAIWNDCRILIDLEVFPFTILNSLEMDPYALVTKDKHWYLIARRRGNYCVHGLNEVRKVVVGTETFQRAVDFDLFSFWQGWLKNVSNARRGYQVSAWVRIEHWRDVLNRLREAFEYAGDAELEGWREITLRFDNIHDARSRLLPLGGSLCVASPEPLRLAIADYGAQIAALYGNMQEIG